jgi:hypothetical protein
LPLICAYIVRETSAIALLVELDNDAPFREPGDAPVAFPGELVAARWIKFAQPYLAFEARLDRPDLVRRNRLELILADDRECLAAWNAEFQHIWII